MGGPFLLPESGRKEFPMSFLETLKAVFATALLAGSAAVLTVMAQRSAVQTVQSLQLPDESETVA